MFGLLCTDVVRLSLHREYKYTSKSTLLADQGLSRSGQCIMWAMNLGAVEIFFILVVVALVVYVLWRLLIRPRR